MPIGHESEDFFGHLRFPHQTDRIDRRDLRSPLRLSIHDDGDCGPKNLLICSPSGAILHNVAERQYRRAVVLLYS
jgi:hypothetical protein